MAQLGKIERITDLRSVWEHEAYDFSKWLSKDENLSMLSDSVGIDIALEELESPVGGFSVDLFASEEGTTRKIIIENQLEDTNHDHLGKIITYASGKDAEVIIWIVKRARDEHRQAIEWLNQHTDGNIGFFLIEIELWKINDSLPAPKFNVVERPNDWSKTMKVSEGLSETRKTQLDFWQAFNAYAFNKKEFMQQFSQRKARPKHWYDLSVGSSAYHLGLTANTQKKQLGVEIYINDDKDLFEKFKSHKNDIENEIGLKLSLIVADKACRILVTKIGDIQTNPDDWNSYFDWFCDMAIKLKKIAKDYAV